MVAIANKYVEELPTRIDEVESAYRYFKENNQRYEEARTFLFKTTITEELRNTLVNINWPIFEVNTLESFVSRLAGEFAKQMPSPSVRATSQRSDDPKTAALVNLLEGRLRYIFESSQIDNAKKGIYMEAVSGGFSAAKLMIDYINPYSFEQDITWDKCYDPTLCYFDPISRKNHKGDGRYCGELVPFTEEEFEDTFPDIDIDTVEFSRDELTAGSLHWFYTEGQDSSIRKIIYVADHYVKKDVEETIVQIKLPNLRPLIQRIMQAVHQFIMMKQQQQQQTQQPQEMQEGAPDSPNPMTSQGPPPAPSPMPPQMPPQPQQAPQMQRPPMEAPQEKGETGEKPQTYILKSMTEEQYEVFAEMWRKHTKFPVPKVLRSRKTTVTEIWHYRFIRDRLLERPKKTIFPILPIVFFDGNSHVIANKQMTRPYHFQAMDAQKMKNITGIAMMNAIENMPQQRMAMAKESIPEEPAYQETLKSPQRPAAAIVYNSVGQTNDGRPLNPPMPLNFQYFGGELIQLFDNLDKTIQMILGNFDQQIGINNKELSGVAIQEGATQSNNAAMPYVNNYMDAMNQIANGIIQVIPKLVKTPRTFPIINKEGLHEAVLVNDENNDLTRMDYDAMDLEVVVKSSVNFEIQKERTFGNLVSLMQLPEPNQWKGFFGGPAATDLLDNMTVRNQDAMKQKFLEFQEIQKQTDAENKQMAMVMNPVAAKMFDTQVNAQLKQQELKIDEMAQHVNQQVEGMKVLQSFIESIVKLREADSKMEIQKSQIEAENKRTAQEGAAGAMEAAISVDKHLAEQFDRQAEHLYRQVELGNTLNETEIKAKVADQKKATGAGSNSG